MKFEVQDAVEMKYPTEYYDAVHSRDAILHMKNKTKLLGNIYKCLKPGGKLLITDYCRNENSFQNDLAFSDYVKKYDYDILTVNEYEKCLKEAQFTDVVAIDNSKYFLDILHKELDTLSDKKTAKEIVGLLMRRNIHLGAISGATKSNVPSTDLMYGVFLLLQSLCDKIRLA